MAGETGPYDAENNIIEPGTMGNTRTSSSPGRSAGNTGRNPMGTGDPVSKVWPDDTSGTVKWSDTGRHSSQGDDSTTRGGSESPQISGETPCIGDDY